ncbi:MAG TPA: hypothetical protein VKA46_26775 [Gemmataceae bacterium]|nr:hypothetical protein [Gemmataceae bacterium]
MNLSSSSFPSPEEGLRLHLSLYDPDPVAVAEVCRAYIGALERWAEQTFRRVDPHLRQTAIHDALFDYVRRPQTYDADRHPDLAAFLRMATHRDLLNGRRREARHHRGRVPWLDVELGEDAGNILGREEEPLLSLERAEAVEQSHALLRLLREGFTPPERRVFDLMLAGERATGVFAEALGLESQPAAEQEREVKRVKDRIKKRLERRATNG